MCEREREAADEVTEDMIAGGVHTLTGFNLDPSFEPVSWPHIVRDVYLSMQEGRRPIRHVGR